MLFFCGVEKGEIWDFSFTDFNSLTFKGVYTRASQAANRAHVTNLFVSMMKKRSPIPNWANCWTMKSDKFVVSFSAKYKGIQGNAWTTISTNSVIWQTWCNLCSLHGDYYLANHFEFKDSLKCSQYVQTSKHSSRGSACSSACSCICTTMFIVLRTPHLWVT